MRWLRAVPVFRLAAVTCLEPVRPAVMPCFPAVGRLRPATCSTWTVRSAGMRRSGGWKRRRHPCRSRSRGSGGRGRACRRWVGRPPGRLGRRSRRAAGPRSSERGSREDLGRFPGRDGRARSRRRRLVTRSCGPLCPTAPTKLAQGVVDSSFLSAGRHPCRTFARNPRVRHSKTRRTRGRCGCSRRRSIGRTASADGPRSPGPTNGPRSPGSINGPAVPAQLTMSPPSTRRSRFRPRTGRGRTRSAPYAADRDSTRRTAAARGLSRLPARFRGDRLGALSGRGPEPSRSPPGAVFGRGPVARFEAVTVLSGS